MIFRRKSTKAVDAKPPEITNYAIIPVYQGKNGSTIGNRIVQIIEKSNFCSSSPLVKRLIVRNVKVWCIVIETSGSKSVRIICASVPYMLNLIARTSPRFKALLEDERVVSQLKFFQEIDFETVLSALCSATIVIHNGVKKCYPIISVHLGNEALVLTKSSLCYLKNLFLQSLVSAFHFLCEDMPHILQSLCSQNYAFAKYFVQNLPVIALGGAKHFVVFTMFIQRLVAASLKSTKKFVKYSRRFILDMCADIDFGEILKRVYGYLMSAIMFIASQSTYKAVHSAVVQFWNWCYPVLLKYVPLVWENIWTFVEKCIPVLKTVFNKFLSSLPKILNLWDDNKTNAIRLFRLCKQCLKDLLSEIKPFCLRLFKLLDISARNILQLFSFILPYIEQAAKEIYSSLKNLISSKRLRTTIQKAFLCAKELQPIAYALFRKGCHTLMFFCKYILKSINDFLSSFSAHEKARESYDLLYKISSFLKPVVSEVGSTCFDCADEVISMSYVGAQKVTPSLWCGLKVAAPVTVRASYEIYATAKSSTILVYPELIKAVVVVFPEIKKGLGVVLKDGSIACTEVATTSYIASQEVVFAAKCVTLEIPKVFRAISAVSATSCGAVSEVFITSSKAKIRVKNDLDCAMHEVVLAITSAQLELSDVTSDFACEINSAISHKKLRKLLVLLSDTNNLILTYTCKKYFVVFKNSLAKLFHILRFIANCFQNGTSTKPTSKSHIVDLYNYLSNLFVDFILSSSDCCFRCIKHMSLEMFNKLYVSIPILWKQSKIINAVLWSCFCTSSSQLWTQLELEATSVFQFTCLYTPELWDFLKRSSFRTWQITCDFSPALWDAALPLFPVLWASNCNVIQCVWEFHVGTCNRTWKVIVPMTSSSWKYLLESCPKVWGAFRENSKSQWISFCNAVEFSWTAMTVTSSVSWRMFHKTVSQSWNSVLRPVTASACGNATSAVSKSLKLTNNVCSKSKELLLSYKTSFYNFGDLKLE